MSKCINLLCRFLGHKKGQTWEHQGERLSSCGPRSGPHATNCYVSPTEIEMDTWSILVAGYGEFLFDGTEAEAEEMRAHKARWERGVAIKRKATAEEIKAGKPSGCWNHAGFGKKVKYSCGCGDCQ